MSYELDQTVYTEVLTILHPDIGTEAVERECTISDVFKPDYYQLEYKSSGRRCRCNRWGHQIYTTPKDTECTL